MKILLVSDVHLDRPFNWATPSIARRRRQGLRDAFARSINLAIQLKVDIICCGGDLFEHDRVTPDTGEFLKSQFQTVACPIYISPGNHDWLGNDSVYRRISWSPNVHVFGNGRLEAVTISDGFTLWGGAHLAPAGTPNFLEGFRVDRSGVHVALFHGSEISSVYTKEARKQSHAPFRSEEVHQAGLHFALLGHYHSPRDEKHLTYPGNPDPLDFDDSGTGGVVIADVAEDGNITLGRHCVSVTKIHEIQLSVSGFSTKQQIRDVVIESLRGLNGYARVTLSGDVSPSLDVCRADFEDLQLSLDSAPVIRLEEVRAAYDLENIVKERTIRGEFVRKVLNSGLSDTVDRRRVIITGLRALDGRSDLEVE